MQFGIMVIMLLYSAYTAFTVRKGLVVPLYRSRALWLGILAILWLGTLAILWLGTLGMLGVSTLRSAMDYFVSGRGEVLWVGVVLPTFIVLLIWLDRTNSTLIRLDYLRKDIVGWKKATPLYWAAVALFVALYIIMQGYDQFGIVNSLTLFSYDYATVPFGIALVYALVVLVVGSIRTRNLTFRNHIKWLGLSLAALLFALVLSQPAIYSGILVILFILPGTMFLVFAYFWYRMARSLVPVNKLIHAPA